MGQCLQSEQINHILHPQLGHLRQVEKDKKTSTLLSVPLASEQDYIQRTKAINRLRTDSTIRDHLYLPTSEALSKEGGMCGNTACMQLTFQTYRQTMIDNLREHLKEGKDYSQYEVWHLMYILSKYITHCQKTQQEWQHLNFESVVFDAEGYIRIIPKHIIASNISQTYSMSNQKTRCRLHHPPVFVVATMTLALMAQIDTTLLYDNANRSWKELSDQRKSQIFKTCGKVYSSLLIDTLSEALELNPSTLTLAQLTKQMGQIDTFVRDRQSYNLDDSAPRRSMNASEGAQFRDFYPTHEDEIRQSETNDREDLKEGMRWKQEGEEAPYAIL